MASSEILSRWFKKYKYLSFAVAILGSFTGMVMWPSVSQLLLDSYGYHTAMGIMASCHSIHIIAGVFFTSPSDEGGNNTDNGIYHSLAAFRYSPLSVPYNYLRSTLIGKYHLQLQACVD